MYLRDHWIMLVIASLFLPWSQTKLSVHQPVNSCHGASPEDSITFATTYRQPISVKWEFSFFFQMLTAKRALQGLHSVSITSLHYPKFWTHVTYSSQLRKKKKRNAYVWVCEYRCHRGQERRRIPWSCIGRLWSTHCWSSELARAL